MSKRKFPRYVRQTKGSLGYIRAIPSKLWPITGSKHYTCTLELPATASDAEIQAALTKANKSFDLHCKLAQNSSAAAYSENEIDHLAEELLRRKSLTAGMFADSKELETQRAEEEAREQQLKANNGDYADSVLPEFGDVVDKHNRKEPLTAKDLAVQRAWRAVQEAKKRKPVTLGQLWKEYLDERGVDPESVNVKKAQTRWEKIISYIGDHVINENTVDLIQHGLDRYVEEATVTPASIRRTMREPLAAFRFASRRYRYNWIIVPPVVGRHQPKQKQVLTVEDQRELVRVCARDNDWVSAALLLMLQGGMMPSEIARLTPDNLLHDQHGDFYVTVTGETKTAARKRVIPVVIGAELIEGKLLEAARRIGAVKVPSATVNKRLKERIGDQYTVHCLRHTLKNNTIGIDSAVAAAIGGWKVAGANQVMMAYGAAGLTHSPVLLKLRAEQVKIHQHLLESDDAPTGGNVVSIHSKRV